MISIITPVRNGVRFIEYCIQNVIDQRCPLTEHIIIDGGSDDGSVDIIRQYADRYRHIRWLSEPDKGQSDAMNKGLELANGSIIGILNADDYYEPGVLNRVIELFGAAPEPSLLVGNCNIWNEEGVLAGVAKPVSLYYEDMIGDPERYPHPPNPSAYFYHKSLQDLTGPYDESDHYAMDLDFFLRAVRKASVRHVDETWGNFRKHEDAKTILDAKAGNPVARRSRIVERFRKDREGIKSVLFVSHDASRTGAPILLLNILRWIKANTEISFMVLVKDADGRRGELLGEFASLAPTYIYNETGITGEHPGPTVARLFENSRRRARHLINIKQRLFQADVGLVYSNTIVNGDVLEYLADLSCPVITHVHELEYVISFFGGGYFEKAKRYTDRYIAVSKAVADNLTRNHAIEPASIHLVHGAVPGTDTEVSYNAADLLRAELKIPSEAYIVGGSGTTDWRKGPDVFIQVARIVSSKNTGRPVHFIWLGGEREGPVYEQLMHDVRHAGMDGMVHFLGYRENPLEHYKAFHVLALTSREDPFPLVMMEAGALGVPTVCFDDAGGGPEFVEDDCGTVVPYLDIERMADGIVRLLRDSDLRNRLGMQAAEKVRKEHKIAVCAARIAGIIEETLSLAIEGGKERSPKIAVFVRKAGNAVYLERMLRSIIAQSHPNWEMIFSCPLSAAGRDVLKKYNWDRRIRPVNSAEGNGSRERINKQAPDKDSQGAAYIWSVDESDCFDEKFLENMISTLENKPEDSLGYFDSWVMDGQEAIASAYSALGFIRDNTNVDDERFEDMLGDIAKQWVAFAMSKRGRKAWRGSLQIYRAARKIDARLSRRLIYESFKRLLGTYMPGKG